MVFSPDILRQYTDVFQLQGTLNVKCSLLLSNLLSYIILCNTTIAQNMQYKKDHYLDKMFPRERAINCIKSFSWELFCSDNVFSRFQKPIDTKDMQITFIRF